MTLALLVAVAGGFGATARLLLDGAIRQGREHRYPVATIAINVSGSLLLGLVTGLALRSVIPEPWRLALGTGFLGGYTTFSTATVETVRLLQERRLRGAVAVAFGALAAAVAAAGAALAVAVR